MEENEMVDLFEEENNLKKERRNNRKFKKSFWILLIGLFVSFSGMAFYLFVSYNTNSFVLLSKSFKYLNNDYLRLDSNSFKYEILNKGTVDGEFKFNLNYTNDDSNNLFASLFNGLSFKYQIKDDNSKRSLSLQIDKENDKLTRITTVSNEVTGYIFMENIFDKYIEIKNLASNVNTEITKDNIDYTIEYVKDILIKEIKKVSFTKSNTSIVINETKKSVKEVKFSLTQNEIINIFNKVISKIKEDEQTLNVFKCFYSAIDEIKLKEDKNNKESYDYSIYYDSITGNIYGFDIDYIDKSDEIGNCALKFRLNKIPIIQVYEEKDLFATIEFIIQGNKKTTNLYDKNNVLTGSIQHEFEEEKNILNCHFEIDEEIYDLNIQETYYDKKSELNCNLKISEDTKKIFDGSFTNIMSISSEVEINENVEKTIEYQNLTEDDRNTITQNVLVLLLKIMGYSE